MKKRSSLAVLVWSVITFGIYSLAWFVETKREMNTRGEKLPTAWWLIIPVLSFVWQWRYSQALWRHTARAHNRMSPVTAFLLMLFLPVIAAPIFQDIINADINAGDAEQLARARVVS